MVRLVSTNLHAKPTTTCSTSGRAPTPCCASHVVYGASKRKNIPRAVITTLAAAAACGSTFTSRGKWATNPRDVLACRRANSSLVQAACALDDASLWPRRRCRQETLLCRASATPGGDGQASSSSSSSASSSTSSSSENTVRFRFQTTYKCGGHQQVHIAGSHFPLGWSFLAIANVPMTRESAEGSRSDVWTAELDLPVGEKVEYKYVVLEEQDWTPEKGNPDTTGEVRTREHIIRHMAIVAWQPGPNRYLDVPTAEELKKSVDEKRGGDGEGGANLFGGTKTSGRNGEIVFLLDDLWDHFV